MLWQFFPSSVRFTCGLCRCLIGTTKIWLVRCPVDSGVMENGRVRSRKVSENHFRCSVCALKVVVCHLCCVRWDCHASLHASCFRRECIHVAAFCMRDVPVTAAFWRFRIPHRPTDANYMRILIITPVLDSICLFTVLYGVAVQCFFKCPSVLLVSPFTGRHIKMWNVHAYSRSMWRR